MAQIKCHLSEILGAKRIKMSHFADSAGVAINTVRSLYYEEAKGVTFEVLAKMCKALDCKVEDLIEYVDEG